MSDFNRPDSSNIDGFILTTGTPVLANRTMTGGVLTVLGCTLASGTTYVFPFGAQHAPVPAESPWVCAQVRWDAALTITSITIETTVFPATVQAHEWRGPVQLSDFDATAGFWLLQNPTTAYVPVTGGTATSMTVNPTALTAGGCEFDLGNLSARRGRVKIVVGATGGVARVGIHGKAAG